MSCDTTLMKAMNFKGLLVASPVRHLFNIVFWSLLLAAQSVLAGSLLIEDGRLHTLSDQGSFRGDLLIVDGRIQAVGPEVAAPPDALRINAGGRPVTPGLFDAYSRLGLVEIDAVAATRDYQVDLPRVGPSVRLEGALNPDGEVWRQALVSGITSAHSATIPGQTPFAGVSSVVRLGTAKDPFLRADVSLVAALGQAGAELSGSSRAGNLGLIRQAFVDAREYSETGRWHEGYAFAPHDLKSLEAARESRMTLSVLANRASDIEAAMALADSVSMPLVIVGGAEAWRLAAELKAASVSVVLQPLHNLPRSFDALNARIDNAVVLHEQGVGIAFMAADPHESPKLRQAAGNMVAEGLPWNEALAAISLNPARIWGVEDQVGSLEVGKLGDVVIWSGDPLEVTSWPDQVIVSGAPIKMQTRQDALYDRYQTLPPE